MSRPVIRRIVIGAGLLLALFVVLGYTVAPELVRSTLEQRASAVLGRKVRVGAVSVSPLTLGVSVSDLSIAQPDGHSSALHLDAVHARLSLLSIFHGAPVIAALSVVNPDIRITREAPGRYDFSDIIERVLAAPKNPAPVRFSLNNIHVEGGNVLFTDDVTHTTHRVEAIAVDLPFISNFPSQVDLATEPAISARIDGSPIRLAGKVKPFANSLASALRIEFDAINLPGYMSFVPGPQKAELTAGKLGGWAELKFDRAIDQTPHIGLSGELHLTDLELTDTSHRPVIRVKALDATIADIDVMTADATVSRLALTDPVVTVTRRANHSINLLDLLPAAAPPASTNPARPTPPLRAPRIRLDQLAVVRGQIDITDETLKTPAHALIDKIEISLSKFASDGINPVAVKVSGSPGTGQSFSIDGQLDVRKETASLHVAIEKVRPAAFSSWMGSLPLRVTDGVVDAQGDIVASNTGGVLQLAVNAVDLELGSIKATSPANGTPVIAAESIAIKNASFDLATRAASADVVHVVALDANLVRARDGSLNVLPRPVTTGSSVSATHVHVPAFSYALKTLSVERSAVRLADMSTPTPASIALSAISLSASALSSTGKARSPFAFAATLNKSGQLKLAGTVALAPLSLATHIEARKVDLSFVQAYLSDQLNITIAHADLGLSGDLNAAAASPLQLGYTGSFAMTDVSTTDKVTSAAFVRWKSLSAPKVEFHLPAPKDIFSLSLGDIALNDFYSRIIVNPGGRLNVESIVTRSGANDAQKSVTTPEAGAPAPGSTRVVALAEPPHRMPLVHVGKVTIGGGTVNFTDNFIKPNYSANLTDLNGSISDVASDSTAPAEVAIKGRIDGDGGLDVTGKFNPFIQPLYIDLAANAHDIELTRLSPYAIKYAGYPIEKGKLSMKVQYHVENNLLTAKNNLFLDQLTFGEHVENSTATKLPVLLAVKLLQNSRGEIDVDLPISGSLSDPQFSMGGIIVRVIVNLLEKAVLSPFNLLASIGGAQDSGLGYIEFAPGQTTLTDASRAKIDKLAKLLADRTALKLDITGHADRATDPDGARQVRLLARVKGQKMRELQNNGEVTSPNEITVTDAEYPKYLERAYKDMDFAKPKNVVGLTKSLSVPEMEKLMIANMPVGDDDLLKLADRRAVAVRDYVESAGKISPDRVFLVAPKLISDATTEHGAPTRVDFALR